MNFEITGQNPTWPILLGVAAVVAYLVLGKKNDTPTANGAASNIAGLFSGSRITALLSLISLASQAGTFREGLRKVLAKVIEWGNNPPPAVTPPPPKSDEAEK